MFFAQVDLKHVVDLSTPAVLKMLGISADGIAHFGTSRFVDGLRQAVP